MHSTVIKRSARKHSSLHTCFTVKPLQFIITNYDPPATFKMTNLNRDDDGVITGTLVTYAIDGYQLFMNSGGTRVFFANVSAI